MASREELEALRALARKRHRAATQKLSRLRAKGINTEAAKIDPRKDPATFKRLTAKQLEAHIARLDKFTSRQTQFVPSAHKTQPLTGSLWQRNLQLQRAVNKKRAEGFEQIKDIHIPAFGNITIEGKSVPATVEHMEAQKPKHPVTGNPSSHAPHLPVNISNKGVPNDKKLKKINKELEKKLAADYANKIENRDRRVMSKFLRTIAKINKSDDLKEIRADYKDLTSGQFRFLWNYTRFSDISSFDYEIAKGKLHDPKSLSQYDAAFDTQIREMKKLIKDVKTLNL